MSMKNPNDLIENQTHELPACSASTSCAIANEIIKLIKNILSCSGDSNISRFINVYPRTN